MSHANKRTLNLNFFLLRVMMASLLMQKALTMTMCFPSVIFLQTTGLSPVHNDNNQLRNYVATQYIANYYKYSHNHMKIHRQLAMVVQLIDNIACLLTCDTLVASSMLQMTVDILCSYQLATSTGFLVSDYCVYTLNDQPYSIDSAQHIARLYKQLSDIVHILYITWPLLLEQPTGVPPAPGHK